MSRFSGYSCWGVSRAANNLIKVGGSLLVDRQNIQAIKAPEKVAGYF
jgi:hypothetical protein